MLHIRASRATCEEGVCPWWHVYCHTVCSIPAQLCFICLFHFYCVFYCFWRGLCVPWHTHGGLRDDLQELVLYPGSQWNLAVQARWQTSSSLKPSHCLLQYFKFWGQSVTGQPWLTWYHLDSDLQQRSCFSFPSTGVTVVFHHTQ